MKKVYKIYIQLEGGCLYSVFGDNLPDGIEVEFILRDIDNIEAGDHDPLDDVNEDQQAFVHYW